MSSSAPKKQTKGTVQQKAATSTVEKPKGKKGPILPGREPPVELENLATSTSSSSLLSSSSSSSNPTSTTIQPLHPSAQETGIDANVIPSLLSDQQDQINAALEEEGSSAMPESRSVSSVSQLPVPILSSEQQGNVFLLSLSF